MASLREELTPFLATMDQIAWVRESELTSGHGRGNRIIDVDNGSGLHFTIAPDRAMDIVEASFNGLPLVFRTPGIHRSRMEYDPAGAAWLRTWQGGLMTTCGLRSTGTPDDEFGLHGRISAQPAEDVSISRGWNEEGSEYRIRISGVVREAAIFGENMQLERSITTSLGSNMIMVTDRVTNLGPAEDYVQILYHCNFGYPFISPDIRFPLPEHKITPRDIHAEKGLDQWNVMPPPDASNPPEQCFFHELEPANEGGDAIFSVENPALGIRVSIVYNTNTLPRLVQWKNIHQSRYVLGLEPTNTYLKGRNAEIADGTADKLMPGESRYFQFGFIFENIQPEK